MQLMERSGDKVFENVPLILFSIFSIYIHFK